MRKKNLTDIQTVKTPGTSRTPRQGTQGSVKKKESGTKRKIETPSCGSILKYFKMKSSGDKDNDDDIGDGGGRREVVSGTEVVTRSSITRSVSPGHGDDDNFKKLPNTTDKKTTFTAVGEG